jgi:hypothetical protein
VERIMTDQELGAYCQEWAFWARTRRYLAPPVPPSIMAKLQVTDRGDWEPDGPMSADLSFFNMALHRIADDDPEGGACFALFYFHRAKNIKALAYDLGIGRQTFYDRMHRFARLAMKWTPTIKKVHLAAVSPVEDMAMAD